MQRNRILKLRLEMAESQLETQVTYYGRMHDSILQINRIRHDLNNQLQVAYRLMNNGASGDARYQLNLIQTELDQKIGPVFCDNLAADALLVEKASLCKQKGIALNIQATLSPKIPLEVTHLCSALGNILDNAIAGCADSASAAIWLDVNVQAGCLVIRCRNPSGAVKLAGERLTDDDVIPKHGLGLGILRHLAELHDGDLIIKQDDGCFNTVLILPMAEN